MITFWLCISMLCCDDTLRSSFATCTSRGLVIVVGRSRLKTIQWLVFCSSKRLNFERIVLLFSRFFFMEDSKYLCFNEAKKLSQSNISWCVKCYGNSTKHNWNVCCTRLLRLVLRTILLAHKAVFKFSIFFKGSLITEISWYLKNILKFTQQPGGQSDMVWYYSGLHSGCYGNHQENFE